MLSTCHITAKNEKVDKKDDKNTTIAVSEVQIAQSQN